MVKLTFTVAQLLLGIFMFAISASAEKVNHPLSYTDEDVYNLTEAIYFEAILEPVECQEQVAHVILNRKYSHLYPNTIKDVIWQHRQFSYTQDGKHELMLDLEARAKAEKVARKVLGGYSADPTGGALFYYNPDLASPVWKNDYNLVNRCGNHLFFNILEDDSWS